MVYLISYLFIKNLLLGHIYEAIKPSSPQEALNFGKKLLKRVDYGKIFVEMCKKITTAYIALNWWREVFCGVNIRSMCSYLGTLGIHRAKKL